MNRRVWLLQFAGNLALLSLIYVWLGLSDARVSQLLLTFVLGVAIICGAVWLQGNAFGYPVRRLPWFAAVAAITVLIYCALGFLQAHSFSAAAQTASWLTLQLRRPVTPNAVRTVFVGSIRIFEWVLVPVFLLALVAGKRFLIRRPLYWVQVLALLLLALYVPWRLMHWVPAVNGLPFQALSFGLRWGVSYLLFITAWVALIGLTTASRAEAGKPV